MRRKITEGSEQSDELPDLTPSQRKFVEGILAGKTASDAYRAAYDCSSSQDNSIWVRASELRSNRKVQVWLSAARKAELGACKRTKEQHIARLDSLQEIAVASGNIGAAVQAEQLIGKVEGHYSENVNLNLNAPTDVLDEIRKLNPALADQLANEHLSEERLGQTLQ